MADRKVVARGPARSVADDKRRRGVFVVLAVLVALSGGVVLGALLFGGDDAPESATVTTADGPTDDTSGGSTTTTPAPTGGELPPTTIDTTALTGAALELADAINRAHQLTYHATYELRSAEGLTVLEVWRRLPLARRDTILGDPPEQIHTREYRTADGRHVGCLGSPETPDDSDPCFIAPEESPDPADPVIGSVDPTAGTVTARDDVVQGIAVRCFSVAVPDGTVQEACFDDDGVPAAIDGGDGRLERVALERGVATEDLEPPDTAPTGGTPTTGGTTP